MSIFCPACESIIGEFHHRDCAILAELLASLDDETREKVEAALRPIWERQS